MAAWLSLMGHKLTHSEASIIHDMDVAYCNAVNTEIADIRKRENPNG